VRNNFLYGALRGGGGVTLRGSINVGLEGPRDECAGWTRSAQDNVLTSAGNEGPGP
jgi:hypothetical protein